MLLPPQFDPDAGLSARGVLIVDAAERLIEEVGWQNMSLRDLAASVELRAPSLYKHFANKESLKSRVVSRQFARMGLRLRPLAIPGNVAAMMNSYRDQASLAPESYRLATTGPLNRGALPPGLEDWVGECFIIACHRRRQLAQVVWAASHGAVILDLDTRFDTGRIEQSTWDCLVDSMSRVIESDVHR